MVIRLWLWVSVKLQRQWPRWASVLPTIWAANTCYNTARQIKAHLHPFQNKISQSIKQNLKNKLKDSFPIARRWIYISCVLFFFLSKWSWTLLLRTSDLKKGCFSIAHWHKKSVSVLFCFSYVKGAVVYVGLCLCMQVCLCVWQSVSEKAMVSEWLMIAVQ